MQVVDLRCPGCGHAVSQKTERCEYCGRVIEITSFSQAETLTAEDLRKHIAFYGSMTGESANASAYFSQGICFLKLKFYDKAIESFEKVISVDFCCAEAYFYAAVCVLKGEKPFLLSRAEIDRTENFLGSAVAFKDCGIYRYFQAFIRYDYHHRKFFKVTPDYKEYLNTAKTLGVSQKDIDELYALLGVSPQVF